MKLVVIFAATVMSAALVLPTVSQAGGVDFHAQVLKSDVGPKRA